MNNDLDVNRVRVFRQLKKEIRGSKDYLIVGTLMGPRTSTMLFSVQPRARRFCDDWSLTTAWKVLKSFVAR
jgi:hypothetical protein